VDGEVDEGSTATNLEKSFAAAGGDSVKNAAPPRVPGLDWRRASTEKTALHALDKVAGALELTGREFPRWCSGVLSAAAKNVS
jgi:Ser/Thr protein kinase RdoA (MazF antagonist)